MPRQLDRPMPAFEAAYWLGYRQTPEKPTYKSKPATEAERKDWLAMQCFYQARAEGGVPDPDIYRGRTPMWFESTIRRVLTEGGGKFRPARAKKRGRPAKARVGSVDTSEGEAAHG